MAYAYVAAMGGTAVYPLTGSYLRRPHLLDYYPGWPGTGRARQRISWAPRPPSTSLSLPNSSTGHKEAKRSWIACARAVAAVPVTKSGGCGRPSVFK